MLEWKALYSMHVHVCGVLFAAHVYTQHMCSKLLAFFASCVVKYMQHVLCLSIFAVRQHNSDILHMPVVYNYVQRI